MHVTVHILGCVVERHRKREREREGERESELISSKTRENPETRFYHHALWD